MVIQHKGVNWFKYQNALIPEVAPDVNIELTDKDKKELLKKSGAYFLRWTNNFDCLESGFWYVLKDSPPSMDELTSKMRNCVKNALNNFEVKQVDAEFIVSNAYVVYSAAFETYKTFIKPSSEAVFSEGVIKRGNDPEFEFWAVIERETGILAAYAQNRVVDGYCNYSIIKLHPTYRKKNSGYALIYAMNDHYLNQHKLKYVCDGTRSLSHETNIQDFLIDKFKFRRAYCRLNIKYSPVVEIAVKFLYPFRLLIEKSEMDLARKISVLLKHEMIAREG